MTRFRTAADIAPGPVEIGAGAALLLIFVAAIAGVVFLVIHVVRRGRRR